MSTDFIRTVTITLSEYEQLRRDAAPVQTRQRLSTDCLIDAYNEYVKLMSREYGKKDAERRLGEYLRYMQRCVLKAAIPVPFGDWEVWTKPGETQ